MQTKEEFTKEILALWKKPGAIYGDNVIPAMKLYASLNSAEERKLFQEALESLLAHQDEKIRGKAITQCLGFFVFRDAI